MAELYGIGELYGRDFARLSPQEIRELASASTMACPFRGGRCSKKSGVCSLRLFSDQEGVVAPVDAELVTMCPHRFAENGLVVRWIGERILGTTAPMVAKEVPFLQPTGREQGARAVGRIDMVLANQAETALNWCAVEMQAVYFSGKSMTKELQALKDWQGPRLPFPQERRRPDYRSSGPKRLMPQLQVKVPTISRWGRKTAVVVDCGFWRSLAPMEETPDLSNCDIAWFVVRYIQRPNECLFRLTLDAVRFTTLDHAVKGLTGGIPISLERFESELSRRL